MNKGFLVTRGLGCKRVLVTRGLGTCVRVVIIPPEGPLRQVRSGGSAQRDEKRYPYDCIFVNARLIEINGKKLKFPVEGVQQVDCRGDASLKVTATLVAARKRTQRLVIRARLVRDE